MRRRTWAAIAAGVALAVSGAGAERASAQTNGDGTFTIRTCQADGSNSTFTASGASPGMGTYWDCASSNGAIKAFAAVEVGGTAQAWSNANSRMDLPAGTHFKNASLTFQGYSNVAAGWQSWIAASNDGSFSGDWNNTTRRFLTGCTAGSFCPGYIANQMFFNIEGARSLQMMSICSQPVCPRHSTGTWPYSQSYVYLQNGTFVIRDETDPGLEVGGSLLSGKWVRGTAAVAYNGTDTTGIERTEIDINGRYAATNDGGCTWNRPAPCAQHQGREFHVNTNGLPDGVHSTNVRTYSAAGRTASSGARTFWVDNTAPGKPVGLSIDGGDSWSSKPGRTIRWSLPDAANGSPIVRATVRVCRTGTNDCREHGVESQPITSAGAWAHAGPGEYEVSVYLRDEAGNENAAAASSVVMRFDDVNPGDAAPARANGWLSEAELESFDQEVTMKDNGFIPVSGIKGYSVTRNGTVPDATAEALGLAVRIPMRDLPEGVNVINARAVSFAGLVSSNVESSTVPVDLTKPVASAEGAPGSDRWRSSSVDLVLRGTDQPGLSGMAASDVNTPLEKGAYIAYEVDGGPEQRMRGGSASVRITDDGEHTVTYYAVDLAGNKSDTETVRIKIDRSSPTAGGTASAGVDVWQRESVAVSLTGDDGAGRAGMDGAVQTEPVENGAFVSYRLDAGPVERVRGGVAAFTVAGDGDHAVQYFAVDGAGNESERKELRFKIDKTAPGLVLFDKQGADKRRLEVEATDATSGVGQVVIGLRRVGGLGDAQSLRRLAKTNPRRYRVLKLRRTRHPRVGRGRKIGGLGPDWRMLPATLENGKWVAYVPNDRSLHAGTYQLQAIAQDRALNEKSGDRFRDGQPAIIPIEPGKQPDCCDPRLDPKSPIDQSSGPGGLGSGSAGSGSGVPSGAGTVDTKVAAGVVKKVQLPLPKKCRKPKTRRQKKACAKKRRYREVLVADLKVKYGKKTAIKGVVATTVGAPIENATLDVISTPSASGLKPKSEGVVRSGKNGAFTYTAPAGSSRSIAFRFAGAGEYKGSEGLVKLKVPGSATLKANRKTLRNGESVNFTGKLLGKPLPPKGKVVDLQAFYRGKWRTFATPRANRKGAFKFRYRFEATRVTTTYRFRARLRAESAYPYELGYSKEVKVRVRGG